LGGSGREWCGEPGAAWDGERRGGKTGKGVRRAVRRNPTMTDKEAKHSKFV